MKKTMTTAERFFWQHAGYSWNHQTETRAQGRRRCAEELAAAEAWAADQLTYVWNWDETAGSLEDLNHATDDNPDGWCRPNCGREHEVLEVLARYADGTVAAALGAVTDPDSNYRRVVEAELASEARAEAIAALMAAI